MRGSKIVDNCKLCEREVELTFHHLIPKKMHRRERFKKRYSKEALNEGIYICRLCHSGLHKLFDEMTLASEYHTIELIQASPQVQKHVQWVRKQKAHKYR